jgi:hypothetical protein
MLTYMDILVEACASSDRGAVRNAREAAIHPVHIELRGPPQVMQCPAAV